MVATIGAGYDEENRCGTQPRGIIHLLSDAVEIDSRRDHDRIMQHEEPRQSRATPRDHKRHGVSVFIESSRHRMAEGVGVLNLRVHD